MRQIVSDDRQEKGEKDKRIDWKAPVKEQITGSIGLKVVQAKDIRLTSPRMRPGVAKKVIMEIDEKLKDAPLQFAVEITLGDKPDIKPASLVTAIRKALGKKYAIAKSGTSIYVWRETA